MIEKSPGDGLLGWEGWGCVLEKACHFYDVNLAVTTMSM